MHKDQDDFNFVDVDQALRFWQENEKGLKRKRAYLSALRLASMLILLFLLFQLWPLVELRSWLWISLPLIFFLVFLGYYGRVARHLSRVRAIVEEYQIEKDSAAGQCRIGQRGENYRDTNHPCAEDLQFWGEGGLFSRLNRCFSGSGADLLARNISKPPIDFWRARQSFFQELAENFHWTIECRAEARALKEERLDHSLKQWIARGQKPLGTGLKLLMAAGTLASLVALVMLVAQPNSANFQIFSAVIAFNLILTFSRASDLRYQHREAASLSDSLRSYRGLLAQLAQKRWQSDLGQQQMARLFGSSSAQEGIRSLAAIAGALEHMANVFVLLFLNGLFHYHLHQLQALARWQKRFGPALADWFESINQWEEAFSMAAYIRQNPLFHWPEASAEDVLEAEGLKHPFLDPMQAVANDFSLVPQHWVILTGSNMSGKSTFLRSLGLNLQLAQMGLPVAATRFHFYPCQILSSMSPRDSLLQNQSYFQAEISRLQMLQQKALTGPPAFWLLDEILRGTNSLDKRQGTEAFLRKLSRSPQRGVLATHDVEVASVAESLPERFSAYFFDSEVSGKELYFDYRLRPGICSRPNAHQLLLRYGIIDADEAVDNLDP